MSLTGRLLRRLGYDTVEELEDSYPVYEYTVIHLNGEETVFEANRKNLTEGFAKFYLYSDCYFMRGVSPFIWPRKTTVKTLEGIQEIEKERIGETVLSMEVDLADGTVLDKEVRIE